MQHAVSHDMDKVGCIQFQIAAMGVNGDGMISKDEFKKAHEAMFGKISRTKRDMVSVKDMQTEMMHGDKMTNRQGQQLG